MAVVNQVIVPDGVARALRRLMEGSIIYVRGSAWLYNPITEFTAQLHLHTLQSLIHRDLVEKHPTLENGWRLRQVDS